MDQPTNDQLLQQLGVGAGTLGAKLTEIGTAIMVSDQDSQMRHLQFLQAVCALGPIVIEQVEDIGFGMGTVGRRDVNHPIVMINVDRLGYTTVKMSFNMAVGAKTNAESTTAGSVRSETEVEGSGGFLWIKMRVKQNITAEVSHESKQTRSTDMSGRIGVEAEMGRLPAPEGVSKATDRANAFSTKLNDLRMKVAQAKVDRMLERIENGEMTAEELDQLDQGELGTLNTAELPKAA